jgi:sulfatase-modifying factor enzyme 1
LAVLIATVVAAGGAQLARGPWRDAASPCPPEFLYVAGGPMTVVREGDRYPDGRLTYTVNLEPFCLARYEASLPNATAEESGIFDKDRVPPAQVRGGVIPWVNLNWFQALESAQQQGWRLPTFEELQFVATGGDPARVWTYGNEWDCRAVEESWTARCEKGSDPKAPGVTGGPNGRSDYGAGVFDLLGNVTEMTSTPWLGGCRDGEYFVLFGGGFGSRPNEINTSNRLTANPACRLSERFMKNAHGEHTHHAGEKMPLDDGFRAAADPGPQWRNGGSPDRAAVVTWPLDAWYYNPADGAKVHYGVERIFAPARHGGELK